MAQALGIVQHPVSDYAAWKVVYDAVQPLRDKHGYPQITPALRAKVFGLNALKIYPVPPEVLDKHLKKPNGDKVARDREEYRQHPDPTFVTYGPKTRRQFLNLKRWES